jgi:hypothetical protein
MDDSLWPVVNIELDAAEASTVVDILRHLAALIDPDDPDGLQDANGRRSEALEKHLLTDAQFEMLHHPAYRQDDRVDVANELRLTSAKIEGKLPPEAPEVWHGRSQ